MGIQRQNMYKNKDWQSLLMLYNPHPTWAVVKVTIYVRIK